MTSKIKNQKQAAIFVAIALLLTTYSMWHAKSYREYPETFFTSVYKGTTDTGESSPIWSVRFMEHEPSAPIEVISGNAQIEQGRRNSTMREYKVSALDKVQIVENTLYFPGWQVRVDGQEVPIEFQDPNYRGLMTFFVPPGTHSVSVEFGRTKVRLYSELASLMGLMLFGGLVLYNRKV